MSLKEQIDMSYVPNHVAIIMDGNGRWAKEKGKLRVFGHQNGIKAVREVVESATDIGVKYLTLYVFSKENWNRPALEVEALMELLVSTLKKEIKMLHDKNVKVNVLGNIFALPTKCRKELEVATLQTKNNTGLTLNLALSYSARWEIEQMVKAIAKEVKDGILSIDAIDEKTINNHLCTSVMPDPELLIRTGGEYRVSNFLLWQIAYSELYFTNTYWPDFNRENLYSAIIDYQKRERRFGKTSEQVN
jgi:undecaprenyl diphosphate synthase